MVGLAKMEPAEPWTPCDGQTHSMRILCFGLYPICQPFHVILLTEVPYSPSHVRFQLTIFSEYSRCPVMRSYKYSRCPARCGLALLRSAFARGPLYFSRIRFVKHPPYSKHIRMFSPKFPPVFEKYLLYFLLRGQQNEYKNIEKLQKGQFVREQALCDWGVILRGLGFEGS